MVSQEKEDLLNQIYTYCAGALFLLMFINLGAVLQWKRLKNVLMQPVGPFLGFFCKFLLMPALALALGQLLFRGSKELQFGLLYAAMCPSGALANVFTIFLKGNLGLSLTSTTLNSLLALAMLPLWILVIMPAIYNNTEFSVPYINLAVSSAIIISAILLGFTLSSCLPKTIIIISRLLKPISILLSFILVTLTVGLHFYVFKELNWRISIAVLLLPFIGYLLSYGLSKLSCRTSTDSLTIAIETSVLNMTVPISLMRYSFKEEEINSIIVIPIMSSVASLCLALIFYIVRRIFGWNKKIHEDGFDEKQLIIDL